MILTAFFIAVITVMAWRFGGRPSLRICPICVGVSGTWILFTAAVLAGYLPGDYKLPIAMLMGGSVVGIAFQGEKRFKWAADDIFYWKAPVIIVGMPVAYWLFIKMSWAVLALEIILLAFAAYVLFAGSGGEKSQTNKHKVDEIKKKMESCC